MQAFTILSDPVRRRILERLCVRDLSSGEVVSSLGEEFGITQSAVAQHLKVLRENRFANVRVDGARTPSNRERAKNLVARTVSSRGTTVLKSVPVEWPKVSA